MNDQTSSMALGHADVEVILKDHIDHIYAKKPGPLPSPEAAILVHEYEDPERVKDQDYATLFHPLSSEKFRAPQSLLLKLKCPLSIILKKGAESGINRKSIISAKTLSPIKGPCKILPAGSRHLR